MNKKFTNHLIKETSPYLLQHAHNPVNWFPWGKEALEKAAEEDKVILVSIGYSACHWCHVMERESFEDEATATVMNAHFVNIKIDREERPDLDHIYMDAVQAISGSGGWPLNVFLTPQGKPFFGGTYFPPVRAFNRSSWTEVLNGISQSWAERKNEIESQAENLTEHLKQAGNFIQSGSIVPVAGGNPYTGEQCDQMFEAIMKTADKAWGGFGNAPKFPQTFTIQYLLKYHHFSNSAEALEQALLSINKMLEGGIYDHVGGGLARYSTDREWLAPHFEKMLYDNALLLNILCDAFQITGDRTYENAIRQIIGFVEKELSDPHGGFYAALDADSEGEEGKFYVWQKQEVVDILGKEADLFCSFFDITEAGNWEGKNIARILVNLDSFVESHKLDRTAFQGQLQQNLDQLYEARAHRTRPGLDDKIILGWNALMIDSIAKSALVLQDSHFARLAEDNFTFLQGAFHDREGEGLKHTYKSGEAKYPAFLDDYAYVIAACMRLYQVKFDVNYLDLAKKYAEHVIENFSDEDGLFFFFTNKEQKDVIIRKKEVYDGAVPSGNSVMAQNLSRLAVLLDKPGWGERADKMLQSLSAAVVKYPGSFGIWAALFLEKHVGINEVAIVGETANDRAKSLQLNYIPNMVLMSSQTENNDYPLLAKKPITGTDLVYLCRNYACLEPFRDIQTLLTEIQLTNKISR
jgi:uncharacterized protein YyaL (SSP411 family)